MESHELEHELFLFACAAGTAHGLFLPGSIGDGTGSWAMTTDPDFEASFVCELDPPAECIPHTMQRPHYAAPQPKEQTCWEVRGDSLEGDGLRRQNQVRSRVGRSDPVDWNAAQADCKESGGNLVVLRDTEDHFFLQRVMAHARIDEAWVGITEQGHEGEWAWVNGEPVTFTAWFGFDYWGFFMLE